MREGNRDRDLRGVRDTTMCAGEPIRQAAECLVGGGIVERHQRRRAAVGVEDLGAPAVRGELRHLDPVIAAIDLLNDAMRGRSQGRQSLTETKGYSSYPLKGNKRRETRSWIHIRRDGPRARKSPRTLFSCEAAPQPIHHASTSFPHGTCNGVAKLATMSGGTTRVMPFRQPMHDRRSPRARASGAPRWCVAFLALSLLLAPAAATGAPQAATTVPSPALFRIFLKDGTALASFGEFARVGERVIFSLPLGTGHDQLASVAITDVDWERTDRYTDAVRAAHYASTRGEADYAAMSTHVAGLLTEIARRPESPGEQLRLATEARRLLVEWPRDHFRYKAEEVHQTLGVLDEVIAGLRARGGAGSAFDLSLVAGAAAPPPLPLLPAPSLQESIAQALRLATLTGSAAEKVSLLHSIRAALDEATPAGAVPGAPESWKIAARTQVRQALSEETRLDGVYGALVTSTLASADKKVANADVRSLTDLRADLQHRDEKLGRKRPEQMQALLATLDQRLDAARRLRLARDQWEIKSTAFRAYEKAVTPSMKVLVSSIDVLNDIRALAGPSMRALTRLEGRLTSQRGALKAIPAPGDLQAAHTSLISAWQMAEAAVQQRKRAIVENDLKLAWNASAAASGAMMLLDHARDELARLLKAPETVKTATATPTPTLTPTPTP